MLLPLPLPLISCLSTLILVLLNPFEVSAGFEGQSSWDWTRLPDGSYDFDKNIKFVMNKYGKASTTITELCAKIGLKDCQPYLDVMRDDLSKSVNSLADAIKYFDKQILETREKSAEAAKAAAAAKQK
ncbi:hypothetical protein TYRP_006438 [Tyrophagus putrescentiae]|nr:hypothetical protein TYRP_006438 [Tyrophagus putrescentiae]